MRGQLEEQQGGPSGWDRVSEGGSGRCTKEAGREGDQGGSTGARKGFGFFWKKSEKAHQRRYFGPGWYRLSGVHVCVCTPLEGALPDLACDSGDDCAGADVAFSDLRAERS